MTQRPVHYFAADITPDGIIAADGSIWSHACTIGQYTRDDETYNLDSAAITNFVRVFNSGYPSKVPVDYEHASTSMDPEVRRLRATGDVPKAGDVLELKAVTSAADFTDDLKAAAEKLTAKAGRALDDPRNLGLWMRWKPTAKALAKIQAGELTELSITWVDDWTDNRTGQGQGPAILAVALTLLPFLDMMAPLAASRGGRRAYDPTGGESPVTDAREEQMTRTPIMLAAVAALAAKPVTNEEEAITELTALQPDVSRFRKLSAIVAQHFGGETDPEKIGVKITELTSAVATFKADAEKSKKEKLDADVATGLKDHEDRIIPAVKHVFEASLRAELQSGTALKDTPTYKAMSTMPKHGITGQSSVADERGEQGGIPGGSSPEAQLDRVAKELLETDDEIKALRAKDPVAAMDKAYDKAAEKLKYKSPQQLNALNK